MLNRIYQSSFGQKVKRLPLARRIRKFFPVRILEESVGDWRYLYMLVNWWLAGKLVPRRNVVCGDITFSLSCDNWITHFRWYLFNKKDLEVRYYIDNYIEDGDVFFDIGANVGVFSLYAAKRYPNMSVFCFEPEASNLHTLKQNIIFNDLLSSTKIYGVGISNFVGLSMLHLQDFITGSAVHTESRENITTTDEGYPVIWREGIASFTLDYICKELGVVPNSIKVDTDGNEAKILEGAVNTLSSGTLRSMVIEMPGDKQQMEYCQDILRRNGFSSVDYPMEKSRNEIWEKR